MKSGRRKRKKNAKFLGEENVSGLPCKKYKIMEDGEKTLFWISEQFPLPIKIEDSEMIMEYQNISQGPVDDSLFELPAGYEKTADPIVSPKEDPPPAGERSKNIAISKI